MMIRLMLCLVAMVGSFALTSSASEAEFLGNWTAEMRGRERGQTETFKFRKEGAELVGSVESHLGEAFFTDVKITGDEISFIHFSGRGNYTKEKFVGKLSGNEIQFKASVEGSPQVREFVAKRAAR